MRKEVIDLLGGEKAFAKGRKTRRTAARLKLGERLYPKGGEATAYKVAEPLSAYGASELRAPRRHVLVGPATRLFRVTAVDQLARRLEVSRDDLMAILGITGRTAQRRQQDGMLSAEESDRLYRMTRVVEKAIEIFGAEDSAASWLRYPQPFFEGASPLTLLGSDAGSESVLQELGRIEYGDTY